MQFHSEVNLTHINARREKAGDGEGPVVMDLKFEAELLIGDIAGLFATPVGFGQLAALYHSSGELITGEWGTLVMAREYIDVDIELTAIPSLNVLNFAECKFDKFKLQPLAGRRVKFTARAIVTPQDEQCGPLLEMYGHTVKLRVEKAQAELELVGGTDVQTEEEAPQGSLLDGILPGDDEAQDDPEGVNAIVEQMTALGPPKAAGFGNLE